MNARMHASPARASRTILLAAFVFVTMLLAALAAPRDAGAATYLPAHVSHIGEAEQTQVRMINRFRVARGLPRLRIDGTLTRTAGWHALDLGRNAIFSHTDSLGRDPFQRMRAFGYPSASTWRGENIAAGNALPGPTYRQWLNSPPHKANWLNGRYRAIGISRVKVAGSPYGYYWVTTFGSRWTTSAG